MAKKPRDSKEALLLARKQTKSVKARKKIYAVPTRDIAVRAARHKRELGKLREDSRVLRLAKAGHTFEEIAVIVTEENEKVGELGISAGQALTLTKTAIDKWCGELALDARQARELDLKRVDALLVILWQEIEPKPLVDEHGFPILDNETGKPVMSKPDYIAVKLYKEMLERRAKMLGLDSEQSAIQVNVENNIIERRYVGADPNEL